MYNVPPFKTKEEEEKEEEAEEKAVILKWSEILVLIFVLLEYLILPTPLVLLDTTIQSKMHPSVKVNKARGILAKLHRLLWMCGMHGKMHGKDKYTMVRVCTCTNNFHGAQKTDLL